MSSTNAVTTEDLHERLRKWAKGSYGLEAAVEALIRSGMLPKAMPYVDSWEAGGVDQDGDRHGEAGAYINFEALAQDLTHGTSGLSGGEGVFLGMACSLAGGLKVDLSEVARLDRKRQAVLLAATSHAGGSHEHSVTATRQVEHRGVLFDVEQPVPGAGYAPPLHPWPAS